MQTRKASTVFDEVHKTKARATVGRASEAELSQPPPLSAAAATAHSRGHQKFSQIKTFIPQKIYIVPSSAGSSQIDCRCPFSLKDFRQDWL